MQSPAAALRASFLNRQVLCRTGNQRLVYSSTEFPRRIKIREISENEEGAGRREPRCPAEGSFAKVNARVAEML